MSIATYVSNEEVTYMKWLAQSPDLNPIENIWVMRKSHLRKRSMHPSNPMHLFSIINDIRTSLPHSYFESLAASMNKRGRIVCEQR